MKIYITLCFVVILLAACSAEKRPFKAKYISKDTVELTYQGKTYQLSRNAAALQTPFSYQFEDDGDLDLVVNGKQYEIDSPYDVDLKKTTGSKKTSKKTVKSAKKTSSKKKLPLTSVPKI